MWKKFFGGHIFFVLITVAKSEVLFSDFDSDSTYSKFSDSHSTICKNTIPTSQHCYKQGCGVGVPKSHALDGIKVVFKDFAESFFKYSEVRVNMF